MRTNGAILNYDAFNWNDIFYYDLKSPSGLIWKNHKIKSLTGKTAGSKQAHEKGSKFRWKVCFDCTQYMVHRIIYIMHFGKIPDNLVVDHIDGDSLNNSIDNIRIVEKHINNKNVSKRKASKTGKTGVSYFMKSNGVEYYIAHCKRLDGRTILRHFNISKYGKQTAFEMACECRDSMFLVLIENGLEYSNRHGE